MKTKIFNIRLSNFINWIQINNYRIVLYNSLFGFKDFRLRLEKRQSNNEWVNIKKK